MTMTYPTCHPLIALTPQHPTNVNFPGPALRSSARAGTGQASQADAGQAETAEDSGTNGGVQKWGTPSQLDG